MNLAESDLNSPCGRPVGPGWQRVHSLRYPNSEKISVQAQLDRACTKLTLLCDRDFDGPIIAAVGVLDVHPRPPLIDRIEIQTGKFRSHCTVRRPPPDAFTLIKQITVFVQVSGEPDIV